MFVFLLLRTWRSKKFCKGQDLPPVLKNSSDGIQNTRAGVDEEGVEPWKMTHLACCTLTVQWCLRTKQNLFILHFKYNVVE